MIKIKQFLFIGFTAVLCLPMVVLAIVSGGKIERSSVVPAGSNGVLKD